MKPPQVLAHEQNCWRCLAGHRCTVADDLGMTLGSLFDAAGVEDPARPVSDLPARVLAGYRPDRGTWW